MITKKELAEHYNVSIATIDRLMKEGLPYTKIGKNVRFDLEKVKKWLDEQAR